MNQQPLKTGLCAVMGLALTLTSFGQDRYFLDFGGDWDVSSAWEENMVPGTGDTVFLVRPYFSMLPVIQPLIVNYRSSFDPNLSGLVIESGNWLIQDAIPGSDVLSSTFETIGGYNGSISGLFEASDTPAARSSHYQNGGTNNVATFLTLGQNPGSGGRYRITGGLLTSAATIAGEYGTGEFVQTGGTHMTTSFVLAQETTGVGSLYFDGGELQVANDFVVGLRGTGSVIHTGDGDATIGGSLVLGSSIGSGDYDFSSTVKLNVVGDLEVKRGTFRQVLGDVDTGGDLIVQADGRYVMSSVTNDQTIAGNLVVSGLFELGNGILSVGTDSVIHQGTLDQTAGSHLVDRDLHVATTDGLAASYEVQGGLLRVDNDFTVGSSGTGSVVQTGSSAVTVAGNLTLGSLSTAGSGDYDFDSPGSLTAGSIQVNRGTFRHISGQIDTVGDVVMASEGHYQMTGSSADHNIAGGLYTSGTFDLQRGVLIADGEMEIHAGTFDQQFGDVTARSNLRIGNAAGESASYYMREAGATLVVNENVYIGSIGGNGNLLHEDGLHQINGALVLGYEATFDPLPIVGDEVGQGAYTISVEESIDRGLRAARLHIGDSGYESIVVPSHFIQNDGIVDIGGEIVIGVGTYELNGGTLRSSKLSPGDPLRIFYGDNALIVGGWVRGDAIIRSNRALSVFYQDGGVNLVGGDLTIAAHNGFSANYTLADGYLEVDGDLIIGVDTPEPFSSGSYAQFGSMARVRGNVINDGQFYLRDGGEMIVDGSFDNYDSAFISDDSVVTVGGDTFHNFGTLTIQGSGVNTINGPVENYVNVIIDQTNARFTGDFVNRGQVLSSNSEIIIGNLAVEQDGYFRSGDLDRFTVVGDFDNGSLHNTLWDTSQSTLTFEGSALHRFGLAGADQGNVLAGFRDNFAWEELEIAFNESLTLLDGNSIEGAALYVGVLNLQSVDQLALISSPFNIYYDALNPGNQYLGGQSYSLNGGGSLVPVTIPEPGHVAILLAIALPGLLATRRRRQALSAL